MLFEQIMKFGRTSTAEDHPVYVHNRYVMAPSPIPRFDNPKMHQSDALMLLGAGREKKIYAIPPYTEVKSLAFEDYPFTVESFEGKSCHLCGATKTFLDEIIDPETGDAIYQCNDTSYCISRLNENEKSEVAESYV